MSWQAVGIRLPVARGKERSRRDLSVSKPDHHDAAVLTYPYNVCTLGEPMLPRRSLWFLASLHQDRSFDDFIVSAAQDTRLSEMEVQESVFVVAGLRRAVEAGFQVGAFPPPDQPVS